MPAVSNFYWNKQTDQNLGIEYTVLGYRCQTKSDRQFEAWITPSHGSNLCRLVVDGRKIIDFGPNILVQKDYTGTPILYPTPNRVRNGIFHYLGKTYLQEVQGVTIVEHGLVHREQWVSSEPEFQSDSLHYHTWIDFDPSKPYFEAFPFQHRLALEFILNPDRIQIIYSIQNQGEKSIPFGFGLHPYFTKLSGDDHTYVSLPTRYVMDYTSDLLPTGRLIDVDGTIFDLRRRVNLGLLDLDHVFTGVPEGSFARVEYETLGIQVELETTPDFSYLVLYSPRGAPYFCLENQTCSTDSHNLYARGFQSESGLKIVPPKAVHTGSVSYVIKRSDRNDY